MKKLYIFAGVNGSGKSTLYLRNIEKGAGYYGARVNVDELATTLGSWRDTKVQAKAARAALKIRKKYLNDGVDFNIETTLAGGGIIKFIKDAKKAGYYITMFYIGIESAELSKQRVAVRVAKDGHGVDENAIKRRFSASFENLKILIPICDKIIFYDNSAAAKTDDPTTNFTLVGESVGGVVRRLCSRSVEWFDNVTEKYIELEQDENFRAKLGTP